jgi:hypothetical protein
MARKLGDFEPPQILYKYRDWQSLFHKDLITSQIAYFASPSTFNDPFDCKIPIRYDINPEELLEGIYYRTAKVFYPNSTDQEIRAFAKKQVKEGPVDPKTFKKNGVDYFEKLNKQMGIFSLSAQNNDILMWGHYGNSHTGFCVGFDTSELLKSKDIDFIGKVKYAPEFPVIIPTGDLEGQFYEQIFSKWDKWSYEDEYRLTKNHIPNRKIILSKSCFKQIIFGYQMSEKDKSDMRKIIHKTLPELMLYEARPNDEIFKIEICPIN